VPKGKKSKRRKLAEPGSRSAEAQKHLEAGAVIFVPRIQIIARLLDTAIELWFHWKDPVSTHLLAACAHRNLNEIGPSLAGKKNQLNQAVKDDQLYLTFDAFRHGTSDVDFVPAITDGLILDACITFHAIYDLRTAYMSTFGSYATLHSSLKDQPDNSPFYEGLLMKEVRHLSREAFFTKMVGIYGRTQPVIRGRIPGKKVFEWHLP
jgi:hypothetical protein